MSASPQLSKDPGPTAERRRSPRRSIVDQQIVAVTLDGDNGGLVLDLADSGMAVQAVTPLQAGKTTEVSFAVGERRVPIHAHGVVRWAEPSGRAGIRLLAFSQGSSADIRAALLEPSIATPTERPAPEPGSSFDVNALEQETRGLDREPALGRIAERTRERAAASGLAIALGAREQMICRASAGAAPPVGVRLQSESGLSGECVRTGLLVRCDDTQADARVDAEVCRQLDLRSAVLVPIVEAGEMRGVLEVFSNRPHAFAADDIRRFEQVAGLIAKVMREPAAPPPPSRTPEVQTAPLAAPAAVLPAPPVVSRPATPVVPRAEAPQPEAEAAYESPTRALPEFLRSPAAKASAALLVAIVLAVASWGVLRHRRPAPVAPAAAVPVPAPVLAPVETPSQPSPEQTLAAQPVKGEAAKTSKEVKGTKAAAKAQDPAADDDVTIRQLPTAATTAASQPEPAAPPALALATGSLPDLAAPAATPARPRVGGAVVPGKLVHRVNPVYPDLARRAHIAGLVVLNAVIRPDGKVGAVQVVSGNPLLARAAVEAVRQWRYEPARVDGTAVETQASIRLNFNPTVQPGR